MAIFKAVDLETTGRLYSLIHCEYLYIVLIRIVPNERDVPWVHRSGPETLFIYGWLNYCTMTDFS